MILPIWLRTWGAMKNPMFQLELVRPRLRVPPVADMPEPPRIRARRPAKATWRVRQP